MLNDVVQNFNVGTVGGDSVLNVFVQKAQADSIARKYSNPAMKEEMMFDLISEYLQLDKLTTHSIYMTICWNTQNRNMERSAP